MNDPFSAEEFVEKLALGGFSGQVRDQIKSYRVGNWSEWNVSCWNACAINLMFKIQINQTETSLLIR